MHGVALHTGIFFYQVWTRSTRPFMTYDVYVTHTLRHSWSHWTFELTLRIGLSRSLRRDKVTTIRSAVAENLILHANLMALCFIELELGHSTFYIAGIVIFDLFLLWPWPWPDDLHIRTWPVIPGDTRCANMNFQRQALESCRLTDRQTNKRQTYTTEIIYHATLRVINYRTSCIDTIFISCRLIVFAIKRVNNGSII